MTRGGDAGSSVILRVSSPILSIAMEGHLRARQRDPSLIPRNVPRTARRRAGVLGRPAHEPDFLEFINTLGRYLAAPVTVPYNIFYKTLTSPLTVSLVFKAILMGFLILASGTFSILAVGAFWWSWGTGGVLQTDGWLIYGSKVNRTPHTLIPIVPDSFHEDLKYDVELELELVRPPRGQEEMGNFMLNLELRSLRSPELGLYSASQPSLPPPPLSSSLIPRLPLSVPSIPCLLPFPLRSYFCSDQSSRRKAYRTRAGKEVVRVTKQMVEGVVLHPHRAADKVIGGVFISVGREDSFSDDVAKCSGQPKEVRTTGWVVVRFIPRPSGIRWLLTFHPLPPLLLLPPISIGITLTSSLFAFLIISYLLRSPAHKDLEPEDDFAQKDRLEEVEAKKREKEWQAVNASSEIAAGLGEDLPVQRKMGSSRADSSLIGGSETTAPTVRSFGTILEDTETEGDGGTEITQTTETDSRADE